MGIKKECKLHGITEFSCEQNKTRSRCKKCVICAVQKRRKQLKIRAVEYKGGKCYKCGYSKCIQALQFHHLDPSLKSFGLSQKGITRKWSLIEKELDKCQLLCANCHAETHYLNSELI